MRSYFNSGGENITKEEYYCGREGRYFIKQIAFLTLGRDFVMPMSAIGNFMSCDDLIVNLLGRNYARLVAYNMSIVVLNRLCGESRLMTQLVNRS